MSGSEAQLSAQATVGTSTSTNLALLPDAPSFEVALQTNLTQSSSETLSSSASQQADSEPQAVPAERQIPNYRPFKVREKLYLFDLIGPRAFVVAGIQAGVDQSRTLKVPYPPDGFVGSGNHPAHGAIPEWGEGADGYAKRYASRFGQELAGTTIRYGLGELLQEDVTYHRCTCTGVLPRISHAFVYSLVAYTKSGRAVPSLPAIVSPFLASEIAVKAWYPARYNTSDALRTSANVYYTLPFKNLFYEFRKR
ncbi:hypothetical protein HNQ77_002074 [Silvibacterium bohemicum]|uniref:Uncharacterized protein n=1 Tax=Silvibacterium bohemicum TaxID=1577686 RepID=A0A841JRW0_9BACT|nr:hypothetical protein [Silvibacterium bohemicum]MBB6144122.1 hypothetical protein [Silvibacterium bohemicum]